MKLPKVKNFFNLTFEHGLIPVIINKPTRITKKSATAIDHILTNSFLNNDIKTGIIKTVPPIILQYLQCQLNLTMACTHSTNKFILRKCVSQSENKNLLSTWICKGILKSSKKNQKLYDKFLKNRTYKNEKTIKHYYNNINNIKRSLLLKIYSNKLT